jgi:hypothetical protein
MSDDFPTIQVTQPTEVKHSENGTDKRRQSQDRRFRQVVDNRWVARSVVTTQIWRSISMFAISLFVPAVFAIVHARLLTTPFPLVDSRGHYGVTLRVLLRDDDLTTTLPHQRYQMRLRAGGSCVQIYSGKFTAVNLPAVDLQLYCTLIYQSLYTAI